MLPRNFSSIFVMFKRFCLFFLLFKFATFLTVTEDDFKIKIRLALEKVLNFIYEYRSLMNVDGLFGVTLAKAHLQTLIDEIVIGSERYHIEGLIEKATMILNNTDFKNMDLNNDYKMFSDYLLNSEIWRKSIDFTYGKIKPIKSTSISVDIETCSSYLNYYLEDIQFFESVSDQCLAELIKNSVTKTRNCYVSEFCKSNLLNNEKYITGFGILHRLLLLEVAEALKCNWNTQAKIEEYCSNILWEADKIAECDFPTSLDDLFLEQVILCGSRGFKEFLTTEWMEHVLEIQKPSGCYGVYEDDHDELKKKRRKREANEMVFGCVDHTTGLAAAVLSLFLRFLNAM